MEYIKKQLCLLIVCVPLITFSQGIQWTTGLSWEQVKEKARKENKYIFLDCFATWCVPCKMMDQNIYVNDSVGDYFNDKFISVKVQMDKTDKDNDQIRQWYSDADSINKRFHVEGYPTFIFLNPHCEIVHKTMGYKPISDFIADGKQATIPGRVYDDAYAKYDAFLIAYKSGERNYELFPQMIMTACKLRDTTAFQLMRDLSRYMADLPKKQRYTKERIKIWTEYGVPVFSSRSRVFQFFYKDGKAIDKLMGHKGYAAEIVDRIIQSEICIPFMEEQSNGIAMRGMILSGPGLESDESEADWQKLDSMIRGKFDASCAKRAVLTAKIEWYERHRNYPAIVKSSLEQLKKYPPDFNNGQTTEGINLTGWIAFLHLTDKKVLTDCIPWMKRLLEKWPENWEAADTYANLLYKTGKTKEAIHWEKRAISLEPNDKRLQAALENMNRRFPTHFDLGSNWDGIKTVTWLNFKFKKSVVVTDENKIPLNGVSITNKRSNESKTSNEKGRASLEVSASDTIVVFSPGFISQEIAIAKDNALILVALKKAL